MLPIVNVSGVQSERKQKRMGRVNVLKEQGTVRRGRSELWVYFGVENNDNKGRMKRLIMTEDKNQLLHGFGFQLPVL